MDTMIKKLERLAKPRILVILFLLILGFILFMLFSPSNPVSYINSITNDAGIIDEKPFASASEIYSTISNYGNAGKEAYTGVFIIDSFMPIIINLFTALGIIYFLKKNNWFNSKSKFLALIPSLGLLIDYFENIGIIILLNSYPQESLVFATIIGIVTGVKFIINMSTMMMLIILFMRHLFFSIKYKFVVKD
jgi:hypothetical protein